MKYQLKDFNRNISEAELIDDLKRVAYKLGLSKISFRQYNESGGKYAAGTICVRFGSWNNALEKAGLNFVLKHNPSEVELYRNIEDVWVKLGRQPVSRDLKRPLSKFSYSTYVAKFSSFPSALEAFVEHMNSNDDLEETQEADISKAIEENEILFKHKTKRFPSERLKVQVLMRDGNKCRLCGITLTGENIHFDHIFPWSKGGETILENLQVLCSLHNLAKGNLEYP